MEGRVSEIAPIIDAGSRTYVVKIDLPGSRRELRSGIFGRASFEGAPQKALMIPSGAISHSGQLESVWVEEQETARLRLLTTGQNSNGQTTILSGLRAGDKVIYPAPAALQEGAPLEVSGVSEVQR
jgi:cobalt-zinc-cadmium efflux system membrane fusion protein